jgi:uncharacterized membrane protein
MVGYHGWSLVTPDQSHNRALSSVAEAQVTATDWVALPTLDTVRMMRGERQLRAIALALALAGIGVAIYIAIADSGGGSPVCLAGGHGCATVANSHYSHLAGVNVAVLGIAGYVLLLAAAASPGDLGRFGGFLIALVGFGFSAYLTYLELFVINAVCQWCVASAVLMTLLLVTNAVRALRYGGTGGRMAVEEAAPVDPAVRQGL